MRGVMLARLGDDTSLDDRLTIVPADAQTCDLGRTFSLVVFSHALYLLEGPAARAAALANLARHLAPGGRLIVDFALEEGRVERPRALAAERRIGEVIYRRFSESRRAGDRLWQVTWAFEVEIDGRVVEFWRDLSGHHGDLRRMPDGIGGRGISAGGRVRRLLRSVSGRPRGRQPICC